MAHRLHIGHGRSSNKALWIGVALFLSIMILLTGCGPRASEVREAVALSRTLGALAPEAHELVRQEQDTANSLKIVLDETGQRDINDLRQKLHSYLDTLIIIRDKRLQIIERVRQGVWESPMVYAIQQDAVKLLGQELARSENWIQLAQNVRLRAELGRQRDFPEIPILSHELDGFLGQTSEDPLSVQIRALQEEYRF